MLSYAVTRKLFVVKAFALDDHELARPRPRLRKLLGFIVCQAMHDGMLEVRIGVDRESGEAWMKYFGPIWYDERIWWDMVPPPADCYPRMLQICMSLAQLREQLPIKGIIPAVKDRKRLRLYLSMEDMQSFQIAWDDEYALDRRSEWADRDPKEEEVASPDESQRDEGSGPQSDNTKSNEEARQQ